MLKYSNDQIIELSNIQKIYFKSLHFRRKKYQQIQSKVFSFSLQTSQADRQVKPLIYKKRTSHLLSLKRDNIFEAISVLTVNWLFGEHENRFAIITGQSCRSCGDTDDGKSIQHFLCKTKIFGKLFFQQNKHFIKDLMCFVNGMVHKN